MGLYTWKFPYRKILMPLAKKMLRVNPDTLSYLAVIVALVTGLCFYFANDNPIFLLIIVLLTFLRMTLNTIDGVIAIERGNLRLVGEIVNALPDRYSDIFVMMGITFSNYCNVYIGSLATISVLLVSYSGMLGKAIGVNWQHHGPLGKVERLIFIMIACLIQYIITIKHLKYITIFSYKTTVIELLMIIFIFLAQITIFNRTYGIVKEIRGKENVR